MRSWTEHETMQELTRVKDQKHVAKIVEKFGVALSNQYRDEDITRRLKSTMLETFQNMPDHANPRSPSDFEGYANLQSYLNGARIVVACGDLGVGIRKSLHVFLIFRPVLFCEIV